MKWFMNLGTQTKLVSAFSIVSILTFVVGIVGVVSLAKLQSHVDSIADVHMKGSIALSEAEGDMLMAGKNARQSILDTDPADIRASAAAVEESFKSMKEHLDAAGKTFTRAEETEKLKDILAIETTWESNLHRVTELGVVQKDAEALALLRTATGQSRELATKVGDFRDVEIKRADEATDEAMASYKSARALMILLALLGGLFGITIGIFIARGIAGPLARGVDLMEAVAAGDFTRTLDLDTRDEVGQLAGAMNRTVTTMRTALTEVATNASTVSTASVELSAAAQSISSGAQEQASALEETAASLEQMTSAVKQNADNAQQAAQLAQGAREVAEKGGRVVGTAVSAMEEINASSRKIADIITAIDEIAFQTNLLALNAAVEAARAGEQGRGFAVVAGEVRNLAQRSASAAKEIKGLIHDSVEKVESGAKLVNQSGATLEEIVTSVKRVTDIVGEIAASSREQSTGIEQVNTAVTQMDAVTQANASQTEELAGTADGLSHQARAMMELVQKFKLGNGAQPAAHVAASAPRPKAKVLPMRKAGIHGSHKPAAPAAHAATGTDGGFEEF